MSVMDINWTALAIASVASYMAGWLWYSPKLFGDKWIAGLGKNPEDMGNPGPPMAVQAIATIAIAWLVGVMDMLAGQGLLPEGACILMVIAFLSLSWAARLFQGLNSTVVLIDVSYVAVMIAIPAAVFCYM